MKLKYKLSVALCAASLSPLAFAPTLSRNAWLQVIRGGVNVAGIALAEGDGAALQDEREVAIAASSTSELLVFDLR